MSRGILSKLILAFLIVAITIPFIGIKPVYADRCNIDQLNTDYPTASDQGQPIAVSTSMVIECVQWRTYYTGRIDLVDLQTGSILSSSPFDIGWRPVVDTSALNTATAPTQNGLWRLELIIYMFEDGSMVASPVERTIGIQVGPFNTSTQQTTTTVPTSTVATTTTGEALVAPQANTGTPAATPLMIDPVYIAEGTLLIVAVVIAVTVLIIRKRNA
jgi:hypothetical protein